MVKRKTSGRKSPITDELARIIETRGLTPYEIAKSSRVSPSTITRFLAGERSLKVETLDLLADVLGLRISSTVRRGTKRGFGGGIASPNDR